MGKGAARQVKSDEESGWGRCDLPETELSGWTGGRGLPGEAEGCVGGPIAAAARLA